MAEAVIATSQNNITVLRWFDNNLVHTISNYAGVEPTDLARRFSRKDKCYVDIPRPFAIKTYNQHMGGVDLMDSLTALYRNYTRNKRWYMRLFYHFLNVTIVNAWIIWKWNGHQEKENLDLLHFKSRIATALIFQGESQLKRSKGRPRSTTSPEVKKRPRKIVPTEKRFDNGPHYPKKSCEKNASRCKSVYCNSKTRYLCSRCDVALCPECFEQFHTRN